MNTLRDLINEEIVDSDYLAKLFGVQPQTVLRWRRDESMPFIYGDETDDRWYFNLREVMLWSAHHIEFGTVRFKRKRLKRLKRIKLKRRNGVERR